MLVLLVFRAVNLLRSSMINTSVESIHSQVLKPLILVGRCINGAEDPACLIWAAATLSWSSIMTELLSRPLVR